MARLRKILVCVDLHHADRLAGAELNPPTLTAIERATWLAENSEAELTFFSALDLGANTQEALHEQFTATAQNVEAESNKVLQGLVEAANKRGIKASCKLVYGSPWYEILKEAVQGKYDLVALGTKDLGAAGRMLFGSTSIKLLRKCPCPVWVTKPDPRPKDLNVLVCSDFSEVSTDLLSLVIDTCQSVDARVHLLHVNESIAERKMWNLGVSEDQIAAHRAETRAEKEKLLNEQLAGTDFRTLEKGVKTHVIDGSPEDIVPQVIKDEGIDLVAIGTLGRSGISGMLIGNTAERLLSEIDSSLLAMKPHGFKCPIDFD